MHKSFNTTHGNTNIRWKKCDDGHFILGISGASRKPFWWKLGELFTRSTPDIELILTKEEFDKIRKL